MVERRIELDRRYHRKEKMRKLKKRLTAAKGEDRDKILGKIRRLSPFWTEASQPSAKGAGSAAAAKEPKEPREEPKKKAPPKKKPAEKPAAG
jgi:hypothetical protein